MRFKQWQVTQTTSGKTLVEVKGYWSCLTLNVQGPSYLGLTRSISWLMIPWLLTSPGHQQPWYWLCRICRSWSCLRLFSTVVISIRSNDMKCKYMFIFPLKNLVRKELRPANVVVTCWLRLIDEWRATGWFDVKTSSYGTGIPIMKMRHSWDRRTFIIGNPKLVCWNI